MTRRVGLADIRFDFDDDTAGANAAAIVDEDLADQIARDVQRRAIVKTAMEFHDVKRRARKARGELPGVLLGVLSVLRADRRS
jgi:hypothetical protein